MNEDFGLHLSLGTTTEVDQFFMQRESHPCICHQCNSPFPRSWLDRTDEKRRLGVRIFCSEKCLTTFEAVSQTVAHTRIQLELGMA